MRSRLAAILCIGCVALLSPADSASLSKRQLKNAVPNGELIKRTIRQRGSRSELTLRNAAPARRGPRVRPRLPRLRLRALRHLRRLRLLRAQLEPTNSPARIKRKPTVLRTPSSGSTSARRSITTAVIRITALRKRVPTCVRRTPRLRVTGLQRLKSTPRRPSLAVCEGSDLIPLQGRRRCQSSTV